MSVKKIYQAPPPPAVIVEPPARPVVEPPPAAPRRAEIHYPSSDGRPMADNTWQARAMNAVYSMLRTRYKDDPWTFVGVDLLMYYTEHVNADAVAPDVLVAFGVRDGDRLWYKVWEEGKVPDFVLEVASGSSARRDLEGKRKLYERLGVPEYCMYDPRGGLQRPRLRLLRLAGGTYRSASGRSGADGSLAVWSTVLGLELRFEDERLRLWDPATEEYLLEHDEERAGRLSEREARLEAEAGRSRERAGRLSEREARLEAEAGRLAAERQAEAEAAARREIEVELAELRARFRKPQ